MAKHKTHYEDCDILVVGGGGGRYPSRGRALLKPSIHHRRIIGEYRHRMVRAQLDLAFERFGTSAHEMS